MLVEAREADLLVFRRWAEFHRKALGFMPSWNSHAGVSARFALIGAASRIRFEGRGYDTISVLTQYLTRRYGFTAMCTRRSDGIIEATLTRRSPGLARPMEPGQVPATLTLAEDERFTAVTRADAFAACRKRIVELDGEILSEIPTGEDND